MKIINILYRGGGGGEFLGSLLTQHKDVVTKNVEHDESVERWFLERDDELSQKYIDGSPPVSNWTPDDKLWNIRLDHGYGFHVHKEYYQKYLWNDWSETKTIFLQPRTEKSVEYIDQLARVKVKPGANNADGQWLVKNGFDVDKFWNRPWESCQELTELYKSMVPEGHDWLGLDPYDFFHDGEEWSENVLYTMIHYLGLDDYLFDDWLIRIENYRIKNKELINNTIV